MMQLRERHVTLDLCEGECLRRNSLNAKLIKESAPLASENV